MNRVLTGFAVLAAVLILSVTASAQLDPDTWNSYGEPFADGDVATMIIHDGALVIGGFFDTLAGVPCRGVARWNGAHWEQMGQGLHPVVSALTVFNGSLYAGSNPMVDGDADTAVFLARWNGSEWLDCGVTGLGVSIECLLGWQEKLIVGGSFDSIGGVEANSIAAWNGTTFEPLGAGFPNGVNALAELGGDLYAAGYFVVTADGDTVNHVARWNGSTWEPVGAGFSNVVNQLMVYDGRLVACGVFAYSGATEVNSVAAWNGTAWEELGDGVPYHAFAYDLTEWQGQLVVASTSSGFRWDGASWYLMGKHGTRNVIAKSDTLIIAGTFGSPSNLLWKTTFDVDADGVLDVDDNCPVAANPLQEDTDGDGIGDACDPCFACEPTVYLSRVDGRLNGDTIQIGQPVDFYWTLAGSSESQISGLEVSFRVYSPDGAIYATPVLDTIGLGWADRFPAAHVLINPAASTGMDTLRFGASGIPGVGGLPAGFRGEVLRLRTSFESGAFGKTICIDSVVGPPPHTWQIVTTSKGSYVPYWPGPYCFTIGSCCVNRPGNVNCSAGDEVDISDLSALVDRLFVNPGPFCCMSEANVDGDSSGAVDIGDISALVDHLFFRSTADGYLPIEYLDQQPQAPVHLMNRGFSLEVREGAE